MAAIRAAVGVTTVELERLTCAEHLHKTGYLRREPSGEAILIPSRQSMSINTIARTTNSSRKLVRNVLCGLTGDVFRTRQSSLEPICPGSMPSERLAAATGPSLAAALRKGFTASRHMVGEWATRRRRIERAPEGVPVQGALGAPPRRQQRNEKACDKSRCARPPPADIGAAAEKGRRRLIRTHSTYATLLGPGPVSVLSFCASRS